MKYFAYDRYLFGTTPKTIPTKRKYRIAMLFNHFKLQSKGYSVWVWSRMCSPKGMTDGIQFNTSSILMNTDRCVGQHIDT